MNKEGNNHLDTLEGEGMLSSNCIVADDKFQCFVMCGKMALNLLKSAHFQADHRLFTFTPDYSGVKIKKETNSILSGTYI